MDQNENKSQKKKNASVIESDVIEFSYLWILFFKYYSNLVYKTVNGNNSYNLLLFDRTKYIIEALDSNNSTKSFYALIILLLIKFIGLKDIVYHVNLLCSFFISLSLSYMYLILCNILNINQFVHKCLMILIITFYAYSPFFTEIAATGNLISLDILYLSGLIYSSLKFNQNNSITHLILINIFIELSFITSYSLLPLITFIYIWLIVEVIFVKKSLKHTFILLLFIAFCIITNYSSVKRDIDNYYKYITPTYQSVYNYYYSNPKNYLEILHLFLRDLHTNQTCKMGLFLLGIGLIVYLFHWIFLEKTTKSLYYFLFCGYISLFLYHNKTAFYLSQSPVDLHQTILDEWSSVYYLTFIFIGIGFVWIVTYISDQLQVHLLLLMVGGGFFLIRNQYNKSIKYDRSETNFTCCYGKAALSFLPNNKSVLIIMKSQYQENILKYLQLSDKFQSNIVVTSESSLLSPYYENELIIKPNNKTSLLPLHLQYSTRLHYFTYTEFINENYDRFSDGILVSNSENIPYQDYNFNKSYDLIPFGFLQRIYRKSSYNESMYDYYHNNMDRFHIINKTNIDLFNTLPPAKNFKENTIEEEIINDYWNAVGNFGCVLIRIANLHMNYLYLTQGTRIMDEWYDNTLNPLFQYHFLKCIAHGHYTHVGPGIYPTPARRDDTGYKPDGYILTKNSVNTHSVYLDYHNNEWRDKSLERLCEAFSRCLLCSSFTEKDAEVAGIEEILAIWCPSQESSTKYVYQFS